MSKKLNKKQLAELSVNLKSRLWRLNNLYYITNKDGERIKFKLNWMQARLIESFHNRNIVLKSRQTGCSTFIQILFLDTALFNSNTNCGVIAHTLDDAKNLMSEKIKYAYDNLPEAIRYHRPCVTRSATEIKFVNHSKIKVGVSLRGGTYQLLHISEMGKIAARMPDKSREIRTGAFNTVPTDGFIIVESTAEGQDGDFYDMCERSMLKNTLGETLSPRDFAFHFFGWWEDPDCWMNPTGVKITTQAENYFEELKLQGIELNDGQKAWWVITKQDQKHDMGREYPATPVEAFKAAIDGSYFGEALNDAEEQGRIAPLPAIEGVPVHTAMDIGRSAYTSIWFFQELQDRVRVVGYYQNSKAGMPHYARKIKQMCEENEWCRVDAIDWVPHDARVTEWGSDKTRIEQMVHAGLKPRVVIPMSLNDGINAAIDLIENAEFDSENCAEGLKVLKNYKRKWNEQTASWMDTPLANEASHGGDAWRYVACARKSIPVDEPEEQKPELNAKDIIEEMIREAKQHEH